jgi:hypothetical protein
LRVIPLLYGSIKSIHVDMYDFPQGRLGNILFPSSTRAPVLRIARFSSRSITSNSHSSQRAQEMGTN